MTPLLGVLMIGAGAVLLARSLGPWRPRRRLVQANLGIPTGSERGRTGADRPGADRPDAAAPVASGVAGGLAGLAFLAARPSAPRLVVAVLLAVGGWALPGVTASARADERRRAIARDLPDLLDEVTVCVEAGLGFDAALARVVAAGNGPLADELARALQDIRVGVPRRRALRAVVERTGVVELGRFVAALGHSERYGVPIARVLRTQAAELRLVRAQEAEERAQKIPVKIVFPLVCCILPALFVVILGPAVVRISTTPLFGG